MKSVFTILGGGIAGLTTSIALNKAGIENICVEAAPAFRPVGAGIVLASNAMKVYQQLGLYEQLLSMGNQIRHFIIKDQKGRQINTSDTGQVKGHLVNLAIHRADLHNILYQATKKGTVFNNWKSTSLEEYQDGYRVNFENKQIVEARYLVVAEGIHSAIRKQLIPTSKLRYAGYTCWRGISNHHLGNQDTATETWGHTGRFGIVPLGKNRVYWYACKNQKFPETKPMNTSGDFLLGNFKDFQDPVEELLMQTDFSEVINNDIFDLEPLRQFAFGNVVFVGDSAHATTPNMGQGACLAIEDALILAKCLSSASRPGAAFKEFEQKRLQRTRQIVSQSWNLGKVAQLENPFLMAVRNTLMRSIPEYFSRRQLEKIYQVEFE